MYIFRSYPALVPLSFHFSPSVSLLFSSPIREFCIPQPPGNNVVYIYAACIHVCACSSMCMYVCVYTELHCITLCTFTPEGGGPCGTVSV